MLFSEVALNIVHPLRDRPVKTVHYDDVTLHGSLSPIVRFYLRKGEGEGLQRSPAGKLCYFFKQNAHDSERTKTLERKHFKTQS